MAAEKLEKLDIMEKEIHDMNENMVKKGDVEKMISEQLIPVKTTLVKYEVKMNRQQTELEIMKKKTADCMELMKKKTDKCMEGLKQCVEKLKEKDEANATMEKKEIEEMIKKVHAEERVGQKGERDELNRNEGKRPNMNLIFHGMVEDRKVEDLTKVQDVAHDIGIMLH